MKKIFLIILLLIFFQPSLVFAADDVATSSSIVQKEAVNYDLPYPGILPDNPLYVLKTARDKMISFLINDPLKKAEFDLLASDKRLNAAIYLLNNNKDKSALAVSTIAKSNNYFHEAIGELYKAKKAQQDTKHTTARMKTSFDKRREVFKELEKKIDTDYKKGLIFESRRIDDLEKYLTGIDKK